MKRREEKKVKLWEVNLSKISGKNLSSTLIASERKFDIKSWRGA
jgi:hypothetical protein